MYLVSLLISVKKNEMFVSGRQIVSVVPQSLRQLWKRRWFESRWFGGREGSEQRSTRETRQLLLLEPRMQLHNNSRGGAGSRRKASFAATGLGSV